MIKTRYSPAIVIFYLITPHLSHPLGIIQDDNAINHFVESSILIGTLVLALLGLCLVLRALSWHPSILLRCAEGLTWIILIAATGALGNAVQNGTLEILGNNVRDLFVGGAIGGLLVGCGGLVVYAIGKLSAFHLLLLGMSFVFAGFFIGLLQVAIILAG